MVCLPDSVHIECNWPPTRGLRRPQFQNRGGYDGCPAGSGGLYDSDIGEMAQCGRPTIYQDPKGETSGIISSIGKDSSEPLIHQTQSRPGHSVLLGSTEHVGELKNA